MCVCAQTTSVPVTVITDIEYPGCSTSLPATKSSSHVSLTPITAVFAFEARTIYSSSLGSKLLATIWIKCKPFLRKQLNSSDSTSSMWDGVVITGMSLQWSAGNGRASNEDPSHRKENYLR